MCESRSYRYFRINNQYKRSTTTHSHLSDMSKVRLYCTKIQTIPTTKQTRSPPPGPPAPPPQPKEHSTHPHPQTRKNVATVGKEQNIISPSPPNGAHRDLICSSYGAVSLSDAPSRGGSGGVAAVYFSSYNKRCPYEYFYFEEGRLCGGWIGWFHGIRGGGGYRG